MGIKPEVMPDLSTHDLNPALTECREKLAAVQQHNAFLTQLFWLSLYNRGPLRARLLELKNWPDDRSLSIQGTTDGKVECKAVTNSISQTQTEPVS